MSKQKQVRLIIREMMEMPEFKKYSYGEILNAVYFAQFGFLRKLMMEGNYKDESSYKSIAFPYLGRFIALPSRIQNYVAYYKRVEEDEGLDEGLSSEE